MKKPLGSDRQPPCSDSRWVEWSKPVFDALETPLDWKALRRCVPMNVDRFRNCIAWLEIQGLICAGPGRTWMRALTEERPVISGGRPATV